MRQSWLRPILVGLALGACVSLGACVQVGGEPEGFAGPIGTGGPSGTGAPTGTRPGTDHGDRAGHEAAHGEAAGQAGPRLFGTALSDERSVTPLSSILASPDQYADQVVRTEGQIAQVCQRMGCWMELREGAEGPAVRVPMAGHSFFLPRDVSGRHATLEGRVALRPLTPEARAHLESEGAQATASALSIEATGVVID